MKRIKKFGLLILTSTFLCGCTMNSSQDDGFNKNAQEITKAVNNTTVKNIGDYSAIGYVSTSAKNQTKKTRRNSQHYNSKISSERFYLAGMIQGEVKGFDFENGSNSWNVPISQFANFDQFVAFTPDYSYDDPSEISSVGGLGSDHQLNYAFGHGLGKGYWSYDYLLSKKSGKIYHVGSEGYSSEPLEFDIRNYIPGSEILYARVYVNRDGYQTGESYWAMIEEENNQLKITQCNMLSFLLSDHEADSDVDNSGCSFDKYGNVLKEQNIYGYNQTKLKLDFEPEFGITYNDYLEIIYTFHNGSFYVLEGLEFKKYDNVIFGFEFPNDGHYCYYLNSDGTYEILYDEQHTYWSGYIYSYDNTMHQVNFIELQKPYIEDIHVYSDYHITNENLFGGDYGYRLFKKLDKYTYAPIESPLSSIDGECIFRDNYAYYMKSSKIRKYDFVNDIDTEIDCGDYEIKAMSEDSRGNIVVTGYDAQFKEFEGYLDENDKVSFEPVNNSQYDVVYMSPIN